jgi:hypothetical protein
MTTNAAPDDRIASELPAIRALDALSLDDLNSRAELQTRVDRKYMLAEAELPAVLAELDPRTLALEFPNGDRSSAYESVYFDTPELASFHLAAHARRKRFKIRTRSYVDAGVAFLEVKTRGGRSLTVKDRFEVDQATASELTCEARAYAGGVLDAAGIATPPLATMAPTLTTRYRRTTLLLPAEPGRDESRATIDRELEWIDEGGHGAFAKRMRLPRTVIVETKSGSRAGALDRALWRRGHRPATVSKYGTGLAALRPGLPRTKWHRVLSTRFAPDATFSPA